MDDGGQGMKPRLYALVRATCVLVLLGSAYGLDKTGHWAWIATALAATGFSATLYLLRSRREKAQRALAEQAGELKSLEDAIYVVYRQILEEHRILEEHLAEQERVPTFLLDPVYRQILEEHRILEEHLAEQERVPTFLPDPVYGQILEKHRAGPSQVLVHFEPQELKQLKRFADPVVEQRWRYLGDYLPYFAPSMERAQSRPASHQPASPSGYPRLARAS